MLLAHLSRREVLPMFRGPSSSVRPTIHNSNISKTALPIKAKFCVEPLWVEETKVCLRHLGHMTNMANAPYMVKTLQTIELISTKLGM